MHAGKAFLVYWKEEDSVSLARLEDMVEQNGEPKVGDTVKVKFQRLVCQGQVAEVGSTDVIQLRTSFLVNELAHHCQKLLRRGSS